MCDMLQLNARIIKFPPCLTLNCRLIPNVFVLAEKNLLKFYWHFSKIVNMAAPTVKIRQDLPPEGGYHPINFRRIPSKQYFTSASLVVGFLVLHWGAVYLQNKNYKRGLRYDTEYRSGDFALLPMLRAERDRAYLKVIRRNRDEEERLMKDVPGWEVGTYYGDKIYHTRPADEWRDVDINEYFAHVPLSVGTKYCNWWKWM